MTTKHLTDDDLQQYVLNGGSANNDMTAHIHACEDCRARVETYRVLIRGIEQLPAPVFDFDLQELVLSHVPTAAAKKRETDLSPWIFIGPSVFAGALIIYLFGGHLFNLFNGVE